MSVDEKDGTEKEEKVYFSKEIDQKMDEYLDIINNITRRIEQAKLRYDAEYAREVSKNLDQSRRDAHNELSVALLRGGFISVPEGTPKKDAEKLARESADSYIEIYRTLKG